MVGNTTENPDGGHFAEILWIIFDQGGCKAEIVRSKDVTGLILMDDGDVSLVIRVDRLYKRFLEGESLDGILCDLSVACDMF